MMMMRSVAKRQPHRRINLLCFRKRLRQSLLVFLVLLAMLASFPVHAHPWFNYFYEDIVGRSSRHNQRNGNQSSSYAEKRFLDKCLDCSGRNNCLWGSCTVSVPWVVVIVETVWDHLWAFGTTIELLIRGFALGFGLRMLKFLVLETDTSEYTNTTAKLRSFRSQVLMATVAGISLAAMMHGSSLFIPAHLREDWFSSSYRKSSLDTSKLPETVYKHIRQTLLRNTKGILECPLYESDDGTCASEEMVVINWTDYTLGRINAALNHLTTTIEVFFRGASLGFGIRMLKFFFSTGEGSVYNCDPDRFWASFRHRALVSVVSGLSLATAFNGASIFIPTDLRDKWFHTTDNTNSDSHLSNTVEVLLRGCSLGFGVRMLYFLFGPISQDNRDDSSDALLESSKQKVLVSVMVGLSLGTLLHGASFFVPAVLRDQWVLVSDGKEHLADTMEVLGRGFSLGFGIQMLRFLFFSGEIRDDNDNDHFLEALKHRALASAASGAAVATALYGASFFLPANLREDWFRVDGLRYDYHRIDAGKLVQVVLFFASIVATISFLLYAPYRLLPKIALYGFAGLLMTFGVVFLVIVITIVNMFGNW